jgi:hypothetical protein
MEGPWPYGGRQAVSFFTQRIKQTFANKWGRAIIELTTRSAEAAEAQIERSISGRHDKRVASEGERQAEEMWMESVARFRERSDAEMRSRWIDYHRHLQVLHQNLADEHEAEAEKLTETAGEAHRGEGGLLG